MIPWLYRHHRLHELEQTLEGMDRGVKSFTSVKKTAMKRRVLRRIDETMAQEEVSFDVLAEALDQLNLAVEPTMNFKKSARRDLMNVVTLQKQRLWLGDLVRDLFARRRVWATVVASVLLVVVTFGHVANWPRVSAAKVSSVTLVRGEATVQRGETTLPVTEGFLVQPGDLVQTSGDGFVDILFVDDSLVSLAPNAVLYVHALWNDPTNVAKTAITLEVEQGRVWANVMNLVSNDSSFELLARDTYFSVDRRAAFDVFVAEDTLEVRVFKQLVNFNLESQGRVQKGTLGPGVQLVHQQEALLLEPIEDLETLEAEDVWVQSNLQNNQNHLARLDEYYREQNRQRAGVLPGDVPYVAERALEEVQLLFTFDDEARSQRALSMAENRFSEAMVLAEAGETDLAQQALEDYKSLLVEVSESYSYDSVQSVLEENRKTIQVVNTDAQLADVRDILDETAFLVAQDDATRSVLQLDTAADRLDLALDLIDIEAYDLAVAALQDYQTGLTQVIEGLSDLEMEQRKEVVLQILDQKLTDLKQLKLIQSELTSLANGESEASESVQVQLDEVYADTLHQLNTLVINLKERAVLELGNFLKDVKYDDTLQLEVLSRLKKNVDLDFEFIELINDIEDLYADASEEVIILKDSLVTSKDLQVPVSGQYSTVEGTSLPQDKEVGAD